MNCVCWRWLSGNAGHGPEAMAKEQQPHPRGYQFGTFAGVFTPSILTILGVIMFLRAGYVVGVAGVGGALAILVIAEVIVLLTALSLAAVSTNTPVRGGGAYFIISRVLGPSFGGAIGVGLYLAQAVSIPLYVMGFAESVVRTFPALTEYLELVALVTLGLLFVIVLVGAQWAIRTQYLVMTALALSILAFMVGGIFKLDPERLVSNWRASTANAGFWDVFAIYFPAVTGIMAGVNLSGDLRDPARSLVRGTLAAILVGALVYAAQIVVLGGAHGRQELISRPFQSLLAQAVPGTAFLVVAGVFAATLSSALGSLLSAPRVLQALARDRIYPVLVPFGAGSGEKNEPRRALFLSVLLSVAVIHAAAAKGGGAGFNFVASVVTMLFLITYGMLNLAAFVESFGRNPSFRPRFRFYHWGTALAGMVGCGVVMVLIDPLCGAAAFLIVGVLYLEAGRRSMAASFGDARRGFVFSLVVRGLRKLEELKPHPKNWRPIILVFSGNPLTRPMLVQFAVWLEAGRGIISVAQIITAGGDQLATRHDEALKGLEGYSRRRGLDVFPEVVVWPDFDAALQILLQSHSLGPMKPNLVLLGWPQERERWKAYAKNLRIAAALGKSIVCIIGEPPQTAGPVSRRVDLWWRGQKNGSLMLILAYLLSNNPEWRHSHIRVLRRVEDEKAREPAYRALQALVQASRMDVEIAVVVSSDPFPEVAARLSANADVVFLGFVPPEEGKEDEFFDFYGKLAGKLRCMLLISSSGEADLLA